MRYNIAVIPGDGIGPEITREAVAVLKALGGKHGHEFATQTVLAGGAAIDACGDPLPEETVTVCKAADAVLLGAVGGPKWDNLPGEQRPEKGLLRIREALGVYANLRPAVLYPQMKEACPLRADIAAKGIDIMVVRELIGGIYFGKRARGQYSENGKSGEDAYDTLYYRDYEIERIVRSGFQAAMLRGKKLMSIDKANVLDTSRLWRETVNRIAKEYPQVAVSHMFVDNAAMQLVRDPSQFDVIVTDNMFGDILSDEAAMITGSIGLLASASVGGEGGGIFEPIHGSAPDIAGTNTANPLATILSVAMMLRYALGQPALADEVEAAVSAVLSDGLRTADIAAGGSTVSCTEMGAAVLKKITG